MSDQELLDYVMDMICFKMAVWFDGENYHPFTSKQELYKNIYEFKEKILENMGVKND